MSEPELAQRPAHADGNFNATEEHFFHQGDAMESGLLELPDEPERRPRRTWRPRIVVIGFACLAILGLSLAIGGDPPTAAVAAVKFVPPAQSAPVPPAPLPAEPAPAEAPVPVAAAEPAPVVAASQQRTAKKKHHKAKAKRQRGRR